jgi:hypothetical protein
MKNHEIDTRERCVYGNKISFKNRKRAQAASNRVLNGRGGHRLMPYRCPNCRKWHLTSRKY